MIHQLKEKGKKYFLVDAQWCLIKLIVHPKLG